MDTALPIENRKSKIENTFASRRITVMGLGRFGGGVGVTRFLVGRGADVLVTDLEPADKLHTGVAALAGLPVRFRLGEHRVEDFTSADLIVVNPAVDPRNNLFLQAAMAAGVPVTSEIRLLVAQLPNRKKTIGITGSAGKSTTTAMIGHALGKVLGAGVHVGGNIGGSLLGEIDKIKPADWVVLELSSFMLEGLALDRWSPHVAVVTNLSPNHLDRHGALEAYAAAKQTILEFQGPEDYAIIGPVPHELIHSRTTNVRFLDGLDTWTPRPTVSLLIPGEHNQTNARMAIEAAVIAGFPGVLGFPGVTRDEAAAALADFPGLPHRLQFVCEASGVRFYNDSKATTPQATVLALESFPPGKIHAILGGYDKKSDLTSIAQFAARHCRAIYTIGATGDAIANACVSAPRQGDLSPPAPAEVVRCATLDRAVAEAVQRLHQGDVVLLSPACASWDQFTNYEQRGDAFVAAALRYTGEGMQPPLPS